MRRYILFLTIAVAMAASTFPLYEAEAIDPVTIAILAPIAIQVGKAMLPHVIRYIKNMSKMGVKAFKELIQFFKLPLGLCECLIFRYKSGLRHMARGSIAPFLMAFYLIAMPISGFTG